MSCFDWLKFFPFVYAPDVIRKATEVRGPYFSKPRPNKWIFGDMNFHFDAPQANPVFGFDGDPRSVDAIKPGVRRILNTVHDGSQFKGLSLLYPRVFESAIADYMDHSYGYQRYGKRADCRASLNWRVLQLSESIQGVKFDFHHIANGGKDNPELIKLLLN